MRPKWRTPNEAGDGQIVQRIDKDLVVDKTFCAGRYTSIVKTWNAKNKAGPMPCFKFFKHYTGLLLLFFWSGRD